MTCIIATPRLMCSDRLVTDGGEVSAMTKVCASKALIVAVAGYAADILAVRRALRAGATKATELVEHISSGSHALVLSPSGAIHTIQDGEAFPAPRGRTMAIGTGADLALGYLQDRGDITPALVRKCQRFVSRRRSDCGFGCDVRFFAEVT